MQARMAVLHELTLSRGAKTTQLLAPSLMHFFINSITILLPMPFLCASQNNQSTRGYTLLGPAELCSDLDTPAATMLNVPACLKYSANVGVAKSLRQLALFLNQTAPFSKSTRKCLTLKFGCTTTSVSNAANAPSEITLHK